MPKQCTAWISSVTALWHAQRMCLRSGCIIQLGGAIKRLCFRLHREREYRMHPFRSPCALQSLTRISGVSWHCW